MPTAELQALGATDCSEGHGASRFVADLELGALASKACGLAAAAITDLMACDVLSGPLGPRMALSNSCGQVLACIQGLTDTGRLRKTRVAQAKRAAAEVDRPHRSFPIGMLEVQQMIALRRAQHLAHQLGAWVVETDRDAAEDSAGQFMECLGDLQAYGLLDVHEMAEEETRFSLATVDAVLRDGGVE
jgi:hypothetical protein